MLFKPKKDRRSFESLSDLPVYNWFKVNETNNLAHLLVVFREINSKEAEFLSEVYHNLMTEYIDLYGVSQQFRQILLKKREIALYQCDLFLTGDKMFLTLIKIAQIELKELIEIQSDNDFEEVKAVISKHMGFRIDPKITTVTEYQSYLKLIEQTNSKK